MAVVVEAVPISSLEIIGAIPIAYRVASTWSIAAGVAQETPVSGPYLKDYDALPGNSPASWPARFDTTEWGLLLARVEGQLRGAATIAPQTPLLSTQDGAGVAILWDLRVVPQHRGQGIGTALFHASEQWAAAHGYHELRIETQDTNAPACRFYHRLGCELVERTAQAYPELPTEVRLIWRKALGAAS